LTRTLVLAGLILGANVPTPVRAQGDVYEVISDGVRLRSGPSTGTQVLATLARGTRVTMIHRGNEWSQVRQQNRTGYIATAFLRRVNPAPGPAPAPSPAPAPGPRRPEPADPARPEPRRSPPPAKPLASRAPKFGIFGGGSLGGNGYGAGLVGGASYRLPVGKSGAGFLVDGSYSRFKRTEAGGGPENVHLDFIGVAASLMYDFAGGSLRPFVLAGGGVHYASAKTPDAVTPNSESTTNAGGHVGVGIRVGAITLESRLILVKGFSPVNFRLGLAF
jgi:hypothetical protein